MIIPERGQKIYVRGFMSISNGSSDTAGGLGTIKRVDISTYLPIDHYNAIMVEFEELPGHRYNYKYLLENQEDWEKLYSNGEVAHLNPDIDTPWIQEGDLVNGAVYSGPSIW